MEPVRFLFDFVSPYAYIAWTQIHRICAAHNREVEPVPVLFAALLDAHGTVGPAEVPAKRVYTFKDAYRKAHKYGLPPLSPPPAHPFNPLLALRVATASKNKSVIDALYAATWGGGGGVETPERVMAILGEEGAHVIAAAQEKEIKDRLRRNTEEAIALGVFGVPTTIVDGELFWGVDSLPHVEDKLAGRDPVEKISLERWARLPASAQRPRKIEKERG